MNKEMEIATGYGDNIYPRHVSEAAEVTNMAAQVCNLINKNSDYIFINYSKNGNLPYQLNPIDYEKNA